MKKTTRLVFISIYVGLALVLDYIKSFIPFLNMPWGGSINIALIPIVISSFHLGILDSMIVSILWWLISSIEGLNPYYINIMQYILDYILPSIIVSLSAIFYSKKHLSSIYLGILFTMIIRTCILIISGTYYWPGELASGSIQAFVASIAYNLPYNFFTMIMLQIITPIVIRSLKKYML